MTSQPPASATGALCPVLLVDDDPDVLSLLEREAADLGLKVATTRSAEQAMRLIDTRHFGVVATDLSMPGKSGIDLARWIRERHPLTEVIVITAFSSLRSATDAIRAGVADYLVKHHDDLAEVGATLLRSARRHAERSKTERSWRELERERDALMALFDHVPLAVAIVDCSGSLLMANRRADALLRDADGLCRDEAGIVCASSGVARESLRSLLVRACAAEDGDGGPRGGAIRIPRTSGRPDLAALVLPLAGTFDDHSCLAAIVVGDGEGDGGSAEGVLSALYGLTPAEASVASLLMQGRSAEEICAELRVQMNTTRTHMKRVFSKTGTGRQGELIRLLLTGPAWMVKRG